MKKIEPSYIHYILYTSLQHGKKKCSSLSQNAQSTDRRIIMYCRTGIIPGVSYLRLFSRSRCILLSLLFLSLNWVFIFLLLKWCREKKKKYFLFFSGKVFFLSLHCLKTKQIQYLFFGWLEYHLYIYVYIHRWQDKCTTNLNWKVSLNYGGNLAFRK